MVRQWLASRLVVNYWIAQIRDAPIRLSNSLGVGHEIHNLDNDQPGTRQTVPTHLRLDSWLLELSSGEHIRTGRHTL